MYVCTPENWGDTASSQLTRPWKWWLRSPSLGGHKVPRQHTIPTIRPPGWIADLRGVGFWGTSYSRPFEIHDFTREISSLCFARALSCKYGYGFFLLANTLTRQRISKKVRSKAEGQSVRGVLAQSWQGEFQMLRSDPRVFENVSDRHSDLSSTTKKKKICHSPQRIMWLPPK